MAASEIDRAVADLAAAIAYDRDLRIGTGGSATAEQLAIARTGVLEHASALLSTRQHRHRSRRRTEARRRSVNVPVGPWVDVHAGACPSEVLYQAELMYAVDRLAPGRDAEHGTVVWALAPR